MRLVAFCALALGLSRPQLFWVDRNIAVPATEASRNRQDAIVAHHSLRLHEAMLLCVCVCVCIRTSGVPEPSGAFQRTDLNSWANEPNHHPNLPQRPASISTAFNRESSKRHC